MERPQLQIQQDFPLGALTRWGGGWCRNRMRALFGGNVCEQERGGSRWGWVGVVVAAAPPGSATAPTGQVQIKIMFLFKNIRFMVRYYLFGTCT